MFQQFKTSVRKINFFHLLSTVLIVHLLLGITFISRSAHAAGTVYYVDSSIQEVNVASGVPDCLTYNPSTSSCSGGAAPAYKTVADVNAKVFSPDDQVLFKKGQIWREQLVVPVTASAGHPITFGSFGSGVAPILSGADLVSSWVSEAQMSTTTFPLGTALYYAAVPKMPNQVFSDGNRLAQVTAKNSLTTGKWWWDSAALRVYVFDNPSGHMLEISQRTYGILSPCSYYSDIVFTDLQVQMAQTNGLYICSAGLPGGRFTISNVYSQKNFTIGIRLDAVANSVISSSTAAYNGADGIGFYQSPNLLIDRVVAHHNAELTQGDFTAGIKGNDNGRESTNVIIQNSLSYSNGVGQSNTRGSGIWVDTIGPGIIIRYNTVHSNNVHGLDIDAVNNETLYGNVSYNNNESGIVVYSDAQTSMTGNKIYNNTVHGNRTGGIILIGPSAGSSAGGCVNNIVQNNIAVNTLAGPNFAAFHGCENPGVNGSGNIYTNNNFGPQASNFIQWGGTFGARLYKSTYAAFDAAYGTTTKSITTNPMFTNAAVGNFALLSVSPAIDAGTNLGATYQMALNPTSIWPMSVSTLNQNSNGAGWDSGAYVYFSPAPTTPSPEGTMVLPATKIIDSNLDVWTLSTDTPYAKFLKNGVHIGEGYGTTLLWTGGKIYVIGDDTQPQWYLWTGTYWSYYGPNKPPVPDTTAPSVSISAPANNSTTAGTITVSATATDTNGITGVQFKLDGVNLGVEDTTSPYSVSWNTVNTPNGTHVLTAVARDSSNNYATTSAISVVVANTVVVTPTPSPEGTMVPPATQIVDASLNVWTLSADTPYAKFLRNGVHMGGGYGTTLLWSGSKIYVIGDDAQPQWYLWTGSYWSYYGPNKPVAPDTSLPVTSVMAPVNGGTVAVSKSTTITATASDNVGVTKVLFYVAGALRCTDTSAPYTCAWSVPSTVNKTYTIQSKAYDAAGNIGSSAVVTVTAK